MGRFSVRALVLGLALASAPTGCATRSPKPDPTTMARERIAREMMTRGDWGHAFTMLDELHRQRPDDPDILTLRGIVYRERGLFADAEVDLKAALAIVPTSADAHAALGILYDVEMQPEAEAQHREAVRLDPNNPTYLNNLGFSLFLRQRFKDAITQYEKAARLVPLSSRVRTNLGFACAAAGDWRRAAREFRMGGTEADAKNNLGFAYERRGDMGNAYELYLEAFRLDPVAGKARSNLVHAANVLGRPVPPEALAPPPAQTASAAAAPAEPAAVPLQVVPSVSVTPSAAPTAPAAAAPATETPSASPPPVAPFVSPPPITLPPKATP